MKSKLTKKDYEEIYEMLDKVSPVDFDCGKICGAVCCQDIYGEDVGIYLLPGEEKVHDRTDPWMKWSEDRAENYDFPKSWKGIVYFLSCTDPMHCKRAKRPIQCRTFPLLPDINENGELSLIYDDTPLPYVCPLIDSETELNDDFIETTLKAWEKLLKDPLIYDYIKAESDKRREK
ncbi:MAG: hypothetical protein K5894_14305 [Lachnospiraceae bacterium]|nr:hypothetical protein [Lachnospiraceae bacterium]MDN4743460.1 hypothetical protein [Lachnospiraceae bacterium C1.1]